MLRSTIARGVGWLMLGVSVALFALAGVSEAAESVKLRASLVPERLGQGTTVGFTFQIVSTGGDVPAPLTVVELNYPGNLGLALSGLGVATCDEVTLKAHGPAGCPADSRMGFGRALAEIAIGPLIVAEPASVTIVRAPTRGGQLALLFYVDGEVPVSAQIVFPGLLVPAPSPFGGSIHIDVPLIPGLPGGSDVAVARLSATLGPQHITYYERVRGRIRAYNPRGILLPRRCPSAGFQFAGQFRFADGSVAAASTAVACAPPLRVRPTR